MDINSNFFDFLKEKFFNGYSIIFVLILLVGILISIKQKITIKKINNNKKILSKNNNFVNVNKELLNKIISKNSYMRIICILGTIIIIAAIIFIIKSYILTFNFNFLIMVILMICFVILILINNGYKNFFKKEIVGKIIKQYNSSLNYIAKGGFTKEEYKLCYFKEGCDRLSSSDYIYDDNNTFKYADIKTYVETHDDEGTDESLTYSGSLLCTSIKNINCKIYLGNMSKSINAWADSIKINMEDNVFNKVLEAYTDNEFEAYKILTPDIMTKLVDIYNSTYTDIDIRLFNDRLYIRFLSGDSFKPSLFNKSKEKNSIYDSIATFEEAMRVLNEVKTIIDNKNV